MAQHREPCLKPYIEEGVLNPTLPVFEGYTPAWGQANAEQLWGQAMPTSSRTA